MADEGRTLGALEELAAALGLPAAPMRIECYDISNFQGAQSVGSMVVFEEGRPRTGEYRRFRIKSVEGPNDFASHQEVLRRRFRRAKAGEEGIEEERRWTMPDLVIIDGGRGQVSAAKEVLDELGLHDLPVVGLAKEREELFFPGRPGAGGPAARRRRRCTSSSGSATRRTGSRSRTTATCATSGRRSPRSTTCPASGRSASASCSRCSGRRSGSARRRSSRSRRCRASGGRSRRRSRPTWRPDAAPGASGAMMDGRSPSRASLAGRPPARPGGLSAWILQLDRVAALEQRIAELEQPARRRRGARRPTSRLRRDAVAAATAAPPTAPPPPRRRNVPSHRPDGRPAEPGRAPGVG